MFLRPHARKKDGKGHTYWSLVETVRTADGPRQKTLCYLGEMNSSAQARWLRTVEATLTPPGTLLAPTISSLSPVSANAGSAAFILTVNDDKNSSLLPCSVV